MFGRFDRFGPSDLPGQARPGRYACSAPTPSMEAR
jgi:hypothetical protein